ncbi:MAG: tyrosine-type recombinase/integrase [Paracoccaceae bacterium]
MADLSNKTNRKKLKPRAAVYTQILALGRALGYRRRRSDKPGRWMLRTARADGGYSFEVLGVADDFAEANGTDVLSYAQALSASLHRKVADPNKISVADALDAWARSKAEMASSEKQAADYYNSARRISAPFGKKTLKTITARDITSWMQSIVEAGDDPRTRRSTANRALATLKAALTKAANESEYQGVRAWGSVSKFSKADSFGARLVILKPEEETKLIEVARPDVAELLTALQITGARFGEIRTARVSDLNDTRLTITGKTGRRTIALSDPKAHFFAGIAGNRPGKDPLLRRRDGSGWPDGGHLKPVATAVRAAGLPAEVTSYALRHGFISRALADGVPVAAVAQHCGTSVEMIMATYAKFTPVQMQEWFG